MVTKLTAGLVITLILAGSTSASEYRMFTNQDGKTITARVIEYDADGGKVQLELKNRKKAWIEMATLAEADRDYIIQLNADDPEKSPNNTDAGKTLSEDDVRAVAERYIKAWKERDYQLWTRLVGPRDTRLPSESRFKENRPGLSLAIDRIEGLNVKFVLESDNIDRREGWLQLLPNGQIKYTPIYYPHPLLDAFHRATLLSQGNLDLRSNAVSRFKQLGIPLFDYRADASEYRRRRGLNKIYEWLYEEGKTWDATEPEVFIPEEQFLELIEEYKGYISVYVTNRP